MGSILFGLRTGFFRASCFRYRVKGVCPLLLPLVSLTTGYVFLCDYFFYCIYVFLGITWIADIISKIIISVGDLKDNETKEATIFFQVINSLQVIWIVKSAFMYKKKFWFQTRKWNWEIYVYCYIILLFSNLGILHVLPYLFWIGKT